MSWPEGLSIYTTASILIVVAFRGLLRNRWSIYIRSQLLLVGLTIALSFATEHRHFWLFPALTGVEVLGVPIENAVFTFATTNLILIQYLITKGLLGDPRSSGSAKQG